MECILVNVTVGLVALLRIYYFWGIILFVDLTFNK